MASRGGPDIKVAVKQSSVTKVQPASDSTSGAQTSNPGRAKTTTKLSSQRFQPATASPFEKRSDNATAFATMYNAGGFPARVNHGTAKMRLQWEVSPATLEFDPLLIVCFEGIKETKHPYNFVARAAVADLLQSPGAEMKLPHVVGRLVAPLRMALLSRDAEVFGAGALALKQLAAAAGPTLVPHLGSLLVPLGKRMFDRGAREAVEEVLREVEDAGGPEAAAAVRQKIPSYAPSV